MSYERYKRVPYFEYDEEEDTNNTETKGITQNARGGGATNVVNKYEININIMPGADPKQLEQILEILKGNDDNKRKKLLQMFKNGNGIHK